MDLELICIEFDRGHQADQALDALRTLGRETGISCVDAAVVIKDHRGKVSVKDPDDVDAPRGAAFGALAGGLVGLAGGMVGAIAGALTGAAIGGLVAQQVDGGIPDNCFEALRQDIAPGCSALVILVEQHWAKRLVEGLSGFGGRVLEVPVHAI